MQAPTEHLRGSRPEQPTRYPDHLMSIAGSNQPQDERFAKFREEMLVGYGYNTARAYRADLDDIREWASARGHDVLALTDLDMTHYVALLRRRKYSENTIRRRRTALRNLYRIMNLERESRFDIGQSNPTEK